MSRLLLVDIGSTYTKVTLVDTAKSRIAGRSQARTTVAEGVDKGLAMAVDKLEGPRDWDGILAASSAAGGLRMVAIGLVPSLTAEAARLAALGAGARVEAAFSYGLGPDELQRIREIEPDIILLAGGTDGGNRTALLENASALAGLRIDAPVVIAGNRDVAPAAAGTLKKAGWEVHVTENVLPRLGVINVEPAREVIREVFSRKIVQAKGLDLVQKEARLLMPTPAAVLEAAVLLSEEIGDTMVVDIGGATTDVHSVAPGKPTEPGVFPLGLPEPRVKRTVEGDLGLRVGAGGLWETVPDLLQAELPVNWEDEIKVRTTDPGYLGGVEVDTAMARVCMKAAVRRHCGRLEVVPTPAGLKKFIRGKDLREVPWLVGTGGFFRHHSDLASRVLAAGCYDEDDPLVLAPLKPKFRVDRQYIMAAMGLLAQEDAGLARRLLVESMIKGVWSDED